MGSGGDLAPAGRHQGGATVGWRRGGGAVRAALEALAHLPKTRANLELAIDLRFELRNPLFLLADFPRALTLLEEVKEMAEATDDPNRLGRACAFMANAHFMLGNTERGIALARARAPPRRAVERCLTAGRRVVPLRPASLRSR